MAAGKVRLVQALRQAQAQHQAFKHCVIGRNLLRFRRVPAQIGSQIGRIGAPRIAPQAVRRAAKAQIILPPPAVDIVAALLARQREIADLILMKAVRAQNIARRAVHIALRLLARQGNLPARQLRGLGVNLNLAPVLDVNSNARNPVIGVRSFGDDPARAAAFALEAVLGYQNEGVCCCGKHFPGHGDTAGDSHLGLPCIDRSFDELMQRELNYDQWQRAINGDFEFLDGDLMPESLKLLVGNPAFFHTRITQFKRLYLYTFSKETRIVLRECFAAYQKRAGKDAAPMDPIFMREDLCLMLRRKENDEFVLSCVSDDQELLLGTYAEKELFPAEDESETTESILWRKFNEYMRDTYGVKVSSVMVLKFGSKLRVK